MMMTNRLKFLPVVALLAACATQPQEGPHQATQLIPAPPPEVVVETKYVPIPKTIDPPEKRTPTRIKGTAATRLANDNGLWVADPRDFVGAHYQPAYVKDFWYEVYVAAGDPDRMIGGKHAPQPPDGTDIQLQEGEFLRSVTTPDPIYWEVKKNFYGTEDWPTWTISIKAKRPHIRAQVTIMTDKRKYTLNVRSFKYEKHVMVSWSYPHEAMEELNADLEQMGNRRESRGVSSDNSLMLPGCRSAAYDIASNDKPEWYPVPTPDGLPAVCNDGQRTRINFPPTLGAIQGPTALKVDNGVNKPLNFDVVNSSYVIGGTPTSILLRDGAGKEVYITRTR